MKKITLSLLIMMLFVTQFYTERIDAKTYKKFNLIVQIDEKHYQEVLGQLKEISTIKYEYHEIFKGASIEMNEKYLSTVKKIKGIKKIEKSKYYYPTMMKTDALIKGFKQSKRYAHDGRGMVIAVIDSGIDTKHKDLRLDDNVEKKITSITPTVENVFTEKVPHGYNYLGKNYVMIDETERPHGMHIVGILAANATDVDIQQNKGIDGVAPNAQLLAYKVFSDRKDQQNPVIDDIVFAAMEDALKHGADVISLSIGAYGTGKESDAFFQAVRRAKEKGVVVVASMGNAGTSGSTTSYDRYTNEAFEQEDVATTVSVAANLDVIGVGSTLNQYKEGHVIRIGDLEMFYGPVSYSKFKNQTYTIVDAKDASEKRLKTVEVENKVVLIERTSEHPKLQFDRLKAKGAVGIITMNTNRGRNRDYYETENQTILEENVANDIWGIAVSNNDGMLIRNQLKKNATLLFDDKGVQVKRQAMKDEMSGFSSWGSSVDLELKPEIVAPGEGIYSTFNHNRYGVMSGTSMSTPVVAGASAVLLPHLKTFQHSMNIVDFTKIMMMNTAVPLLDTTHLENSPRQQGAGMLNVEATFQNNVLITSENKGAITLKEFSKDVLQFAVTLENLNNETETFNIRTSHVLTSGLYPKQKEGEIVKEVHSQKIENAWIQIPTKKIELAPKQKQTIYFTLNTPSDIQNKFVEGFIYFDSTSNPNLSIPFFGYKGDWQFNNIIDAPMWEQHSKTKLTSLMTTSSLASNKYIPLGLNDFFDVSKGVHPEKVAITSDSKNTVTGSAFLRLTVLRDLVDFSVEIVDEKSEDAVSLRTLQKGDFLERFRYVDFFENEYFSKKYLNPEENIRWDGKLFDAALGEMMPAKEGQYYVRIKVRNDLSKAYQYTYLPIKIDNTPPTATLKENGDIMVDVDDNEAVWFVYATINHQKLEIEKVNEKQYIVKNIPTESSGDLNIDVIDIAGNKTTLVKKLEKPVVIFENLEEVKSRGRVKELTAKLTSKVEQITATLNDSPIPVEVQDQQATFKISRTVKEGSNTFTYSVIGEKNETKTMTFVRDTKKPTFDDTSTYDDNDEFLLMNDKGYGVIRGTVKDNVTDASKIKIYYYLSKDKRNKGLWKSITPDEEGRIELKVFKSDYPESIELEFVDEAGRKHNTIIQIAEPDYSDPPARAITVHLSKINNFLKEENLGTELIQDEAHSNQFYYDLKLDSSEEGYFVKINGSDFIPFDESGNLKHTLTLNSGANIVDIEGYNDQKQLVSQYKYFFFVDIEMPKYELENFMILPTLENEKNPHVKGTIYLPNERFTFKGTAEDNGLEWYLYINDSIAQRGKAWREFGMNKRNFAFETVLNDNDLMKFRISDYFGNAENDNYTKYRIKIDKEKPIVKINETVFKNVANIKAQFEDNYGLVSYGLEINGKNYVNEATIDKVGTYVYVLNAKDYAGNITKERGTIKVLGELEAVQLKTKANKETFENIDAWLQLGEGTNAKILSMSDNEIKVLLYNELEEKIVQYQIEVEKEIKVQPDVEKSPITPNKPKIENPIIQHKPNISLPETMENTPIVSEKPIINHQPKQKEEQTQKEDPKETIIAPEKTKQENTESKNIEQQTKKDNTLYYVIGAIGIALFAMIIAGKKNK